jgi:hypothetical protein
MACTCLRVRGSDDKPVFVIRSPAGLTENAETTYVTPVLKAMCAEACENYLMCKAVWSGLNPRLDGYLAPDLPIMQHCFYQRLDPSALLDDIYMKSIRRIEIDIHSYSCSQHNTTIP